ncbi:methyl-accepting chemotaxis protein [Photobacterium sp. MCCC 1A19761]|uniref:methyl-accepting chemotaxis protein n=1 Tax=Photobacterium sp. MCCC 1A19761 TaxID=3115000 RepID=UPI00307F54D9
MKLQSKLLFSTTALAITFVIASSLILGSLTLNEARQLLLANAQNQLVASRNQAAMQVENYFSTAYGQINTASDNLMYIEAMQAFTQAFFQRPITQTADPALTDYYQNQFSRQFTALNPGSTANVSQMLSGLSDLALSFQSAFIARNPAPLGAKDELTQLDESSAYAGVHAKYHPVIREFLQTFGYYDIFLVEPTSGHVVYSVFKELDFATSLKNGPYANTGLSEAFRQALNSQTASLTDFQPYLPSYNAEAAFISAPIVDHGNLIGVLIFQMPVERLNAIMTHDHQWEETGFGESGETYLIGDDELMRSDSRFLIEDPVGYATLMQNTGLSEATIAKMTAKKTTMGLQPISTQGSRNALAGQTGFDSFVNYRGHEVLAAFQPLDIPGLNWAILSEVDESEALLLATRLQSKTMQTLAGMLVCAVIISGLVGWLLARTISSPLREMVHTVSGLSSGTGDLSYRLKDTRNDELGVLAKGVNHFIGYLDKTFSGLLDAVARMKPMSEDVRDINTSLSRYADETQIQSEQVRERLTQSLAASRTVESELSNIKAAAENATSEVSNGRKAVSTTVAKMQELKQEIGDVSSAVVQLKNDAKEIVRIVDVISGIAEQTNLLALNASIEAARAGEMGRGFAVVADEVRGLAARTRESTDDVTNMVNNISNSTSHLSLIMEKGLVSTEDCTAKVTQTESNWADIETAMHTIEAHVSQIDHAIHEQLGVLSSVSDNFQQMDSSFEETRNVIELCAILSNDITKLGDKLHSLTNNFTVTVAEHSTQRTQRRNIIRAERA